MAYAASDKTLERLCHPGARRPAGDATRPRGTRCWPRRPSPTPFMRHEYLAALHASRQRDRRAPAGRRSSSRCGAATSCTRPAPLYLKDHSYGEYVFDWAWADAYQRHGLRYYPKLLVAVPFTPVPGARLLARDDAARAARWCRRCAPGAREHEAVVGARAVPRRRRRRGAAATPAGCCATRVQFHWTQREPQPYADFDDFLAQPAARQAQEDPAGAAHGGRGRRRRFTRARGRRRSPTRRLGLLLPLLRAHLPRARHSTPYLTRDFFARMARDDGRSTGCCSSPQRDGERDRRVADRASTATRGARLRPLLGRARARRLPALRGLLLPAAGLVHRARLSRASKAARRASTRWRAA